MYTGFRFNQEMMYARVYINFVMQTFYNHGCHAGSMRHKLSALIAAPTNVVTFVSAPSNSAKSKTRTG